MGVTQAEHDSAFLFHSKMHIRTQMIRWWVKPALTSKNVSHVQVSVLPT